MKQLSRSVGLMFIFDLLVFAISTYCFANMFCSFKITILTVALVTVVGLFSLFLKGQYKIREHNVTVWNAYRLFEGVVFANMPVGILLFFFVPKLVLAKFLVLNILAIYICLLLYRFCFHHYLFEYKKVKKVLIIGANDKAKAVVDVIKNKEALKMEVVGIVKSAKIDKTLWDRFAEHYHINTSEIDKLRQENKIKLEQSFTCDNVTIFEDGKDIISILDNTKPNIVVFATNSQLVPVIDTNIQIYQMTEFYEMATGKFFVHDDTMPELSTEFALKERTLSGRLYRVCKRIYDIIAALIILTVTLPVTGYIALRVWLIDFKSPFFTQTRVGRNQKTFNCYKLRTMYSNDYKPKNGNDVKYAESVEGDDRIIPFCRFVRKARFDEIPQMINILKGEMSIVGPRAEWVDEVEIFAEQIPYHHVRYYVKAGWTGWSHINMNPVFSVEEEKERLAYDIYYMKHRNVLWEIGILVKAVFLALGGRHK